MNKYYCTVRLKGKLFVMEEVNGAITRIPREEFFAEWTGRTVSFKSAETDETKSFNLAKYWFNSKSRRNYRNYVFDPQHEFDLKSDTYNIWRGFATRPIEGDCRLFLDHMKDVMSNGDVGFYEYSLAFFAQIVQEPWRIFGTSLVYRGDVEGTGKSYGVSRIGEMLNGEPLPDKIGSLYFSTADPKLLYGDFTDHLECVLLLHSEEAVPASNHGYENSQKELITGQYLRLNGKNVPIRSALNHIRLVITGNSDWIASISVYGRRFSVSDVNDDHANDEEYFNALNYEWEHGGREALMYFLMHYDWKRFNLRVPYKNDALLKQKINSLEGVKGWWYNVLKKGEMPYSSFHEHDGSCKVSSSALYYNYVSFSKQQRHKRIESDDSFWRKLRDLVPVTDAKGKEIKGKGGKIVSLIETCKVPNPNRAYDKKPQIEGRAFPSLATCRRLLDMKLGWEIDWENIDDNWDLSAKTLSDILSNYN